MSGPYEVVYCDFPWPYSAFGTAKLSYDQMSEEQIATFDWSPYLAKRCAVFAWVTGPKLDLSFRCFEEWRKRHGLHYQGIAYTWIKTTKDGVPIKASGPRPRLVKPLDEWVVVLSTHPKERVFPLLTESQVQHVTAPASDAELEWLSLLDANSDIVFSPKERTHSRKPPIFRDNIVELLGDRPRVELFAREAWPGWDRWGNESPE